MKYLYFLLLLFPLFLFGSQSNVSLGLSSNVSFGQLRGDAIKLREISSALRGSRAAIEGDKSGLQETVEEVKAKIDTIKAEYALLAKPTASMINADHVIYNASEYPMHIRTIVHELADTVMLFRMLLDRKDSALDAQAGIKDELGYLAQSDRQGFVEACAVILPSADEQLEKYAQKIQLLRQLLKESVFRYFQPSIKQALQESKDAKLLLWHQALKQQKDLEDKIIGLETEAKSLEKEYEFLKNRHLEKVTIYADKKTVSTGMWGYLASKLSLKKDHEKEQQRLHAEQELQYQQLFEEQQREIADLVLMKQEDQAMRDLMVSEKKEKERCLQKEYTAFRKQHEKARLQNQEEQREKQRTANRKQEMERLLEAQNQERKKQEEQTLQVQKQQRLAAAAQEAAEQARLETVREEEGILHELNRAARLEQIEFRPNISFADFKKTFGKDKVTCNSMKKLFSSLNQSLAAIYQDDLSDAQIDAFHEYCNKIVELDRNMKKDCIGISYYMALFPDFYNSIKALFIDLREEVLKSREKMTEFENIKISVLKDLKLKLEKDLADIKGYYTTAKANDTSIDILNGTVAELITIQKKVNYLSELINYSKKKNVVLSLYKICNPAGILHADRFLQKSCLDTLESTALDRYDLNTVFLELSNSLQNILDASIDGDSQGVDSALNIVQSKSDEVYKVTKVIINAIFNSIELKDEGVKAELIELCVKNAKSFSVQLARELFNADSFRQSPHLLFGDVMDRLTKDQRNTIIDLNLKLIRLFSEKFHKQGARI